MAVDCMTWLTPPEAVGAPQVVQLLLMSQHAKQNQPCNATAALQEVGAKAVDCTPPEGMEVKKFEM